MKRIYWIVFLSLACLGTTYIMKEGEVEVGRYSVNDGSNDVKIEQMGPRKKSVEAPVYNNDDVGYTATFKKPDGPLKVWKVRGRVVDAINLNVIRSGEVLFSGGGENISASILNNGMFTVELPQLEASSYVMSVKAPGDYDANLEILRGSDFASIPREKRIQMRGSASFSSPLIASQELDLEIGLIRQKWTEEENNEYYELMRKMSGSGN